MGASYEITSQSALPKMQNSVLIKNQSILTFCECPALDQDVRMDKVDSKKHFSTAKADDSQVFLSF